MNSEEIDDKVGEWHDSDTELELWEFLEMTKEEYACWVETGYINKGKNDTD